MFKIQNSTIHCSRGDTGSITLRLPYTDGHNYIQYKDVSDNVYWYDPVRKILYDDDYEESSVSLATLTEQLYQFQIGDEIKFNIYEKKGYDKTPLLSKTFVVDTADYELTITLTEDDTTFGDIPNKETEYWYDITLNEDLTVVGYDESGAKLFMMYPAKGCDE